MTTEMLVNLVNAENRIMAHIQVELRVRIVIKVKKVFMPSRVIS